MGVRADAETLQQIPLFRNCEAVPLQVLAFAAERQHFRRGEAIIKQGQKASAAYFILNGTAELAQNRETVGQAEPGALLGEVAMLASTPYSITATAESDVAVVRIDNSLFQRVAIEYPEFGRAVLNALSQRLGTSVGELEGIRKILTQARSFSAL